MAVEDLKKLHQLLDKYCKLVEAGELCAGDCPNDGVSCSTGVCRAHLRYVMINKYYYREFSPYVNFITAVFQNYY